MGEILQNNIEKYSHKGEEIYELRKKAFDELKKRKIKITRNRTRPVCDKFSLASKINFEQEFDSHQLKKLCAELHRKVKARGWLNTATGGIAVIFNGAKHIQNMRMLYGGACALANWSECQAELKNILGEIKKNKNKLKNVRKGGGSQNEEAGSLETKINDLKKELKYQKAIEKRALDTMRNSGNPLFERCANEKNLELMRRLVVEGIFEERKAIYKDGNISFKMMLEGMTAVF
jgi:hypothetical protein